NGVVAGTANGVNAGNIGNSSPPGFATGTLTTEEESDTRLIRVNQKNSQGKVKHKKFQDATFHLVPKKRHELSPITSLLPSQGTPLVASLTGSIDESLPTWTGQRLFRSGIRGDTNCLPFGAFATRHYDQIFFRNTSPVPQRIFVDFIPGCGFNTFMAAYAGPGFDPTNICNNFIADAGLSGPVNWEFVVCPGEDFSIVVSQLEPLLTCPFYSMNVF